MIPTDDTDGGLYAVEDLLSGWDAGDDLSYARTPDATTYLTACREGLRVPDTDETARARALHDHRITRALSRAVEGRRVVAFMGGHRLPRGSAPYRIIADSARALAAEGLLVTSGGGPGAMEAAHLGARWSGSPPDELADVVQTLGRVPELPAYGPNDLVGPDGSFDADLLRALHRWQAPAFEVAGRLPAGRAGESVGIPTWLYGHEPPTPLATAHAKYFENSIREDGLLAIAKAGVVFAEGSAGTLQEVFQDAAQNHYASVDGTRSPMVFLDLDEFWTVRRPVRLLLDGLFDDATERLLHFVTSADQIVEAVLSHDSRVTGDLLRQHRSG